MAGIRVLIRGAGDLATGVALRLRRSGLTVIMTEVERPLAVRRGAAFAEAVFAGTVEVEGIGARLCLPADAIRTAAAGEVPVLVDPAAVCLAALEPQVVVDAIMAKRNTGTHHRQAPLVVALGPGFTAGVDCHAVIETNRGHDLGRVIWQGSAQADTGEPGALAGAGRHAGRVLRAPAGGRLEPKAAIADRLPAEALIALVYDGGGAVYPVRAPFTGVLRGLLHPSVPVEAGMKIGDLDQRGDPAACFTASDKSLAIGGGVLEAILMHLSQSSFSEFP